MMIISSIVGLKISFFGLLNSPVAWRDSTCPRLGSSAKNYYDWKKLDPAATFGRSIKRPPYGNRSAFKCWDAGQDLLNVETSRRCVHRNGRTDTSGGIEYRHGKADQARQKFLDIETDLC